MVVKAPGARPRPEVDTEQAPIRPAGGEGRGWWQLALATYGVGLAFVGADRLVPGDQPWAVAITAGTSAAGTACVLHGFRKRGRGRLVRRTTEALLPVMRDPVMQERAMDGNRRVRGPLLREPVLRDLSFDLTARRWAGGWLGCPRNVKVTVPPTFDYSEEVIDSVLAVLHRGFAGRYRLHRKDTRKGILQFRLLQVAAAAGQADEETPQTEETEAHPTVRRANKALRELLGASVEVRPILGSDGEPEAFTCQFEANSKVVAPPFRLKVEKTLSTLLPGRWRAKWDLENDEVHIEQRPKLPTKIPHPRITVEGSDILASYKRVTIPYAWDEDHRTMVWRPGLSPHFAVVGTTGSGKTALMHGLLTEVTARGWQTYVVDGKGIEFLAFRDWPNVRYVATEIEDQIATIHHVWEQQQERYRLIKAGLAREDQFEPIVLFLDEYREFYGELMDWWAANRHKKNDPPKPPVLEKVRSIARKGRSARIHLVLGTQRPDADFMTGEMRDNFRMRVSMGRLSPHGAIMMWDSATIGVSIPDGTQGRGTTVDEHGKPAEIQSFWTPDPRKVEEGDVEDAELVDALMSAESVHSRQVVRPASRGPNREPVTTYGAWAYAEFLDAEAHPELLEIQRPPTRRKGRVSGGNAEEGDDLEPDEQEDKAIDLSDGYGPVEDCPVEDISAGDLVLIDEDGDTWAVVEDAVPDIDDPDCYVIAWRNDADDAGDRLVPSDQLVSCRHPLEHDDAP